MGLGNKILVALAAEMVASTASAAAITGKGSGPDGKPFMGAFVVASTPQSKRSVSVLSDPQGRYHIDDLPAATYTVAINTIGYQSEPRMGVALAIDGKAAFDFALQKAPVL